MVDVLTFVFEWGFFFINGYVMWLGIKVIYQRVKHYRKYRFKMGTRVRPKTGISVGDVIAVGDINGHSKVCVLYDHDIHREDAGKAVPPFGSGKMYWYMKEDLEKA
jgi:hypothetical protein